ncbi:hypothetical protein Bca52824_074100 [Brassica carinata]|uniref:Uncharacterized protein n=1 Tax=Brassica carinata TaxID=52824 RepID=A0A8X7U8L3_BRACI|nr:hypothetical protein Bca52824_074100 [Brassica carinata]
MQSFATALGELARDLRQSPWTNPRSKLYVTGFDTCLASKDDIKKMVRGLFPGCVGCYVRRGGSVLVYIRGQDDIDNALKLSGVSVRGFKIAVDTVLPIERVIVGTPAMYLPPLPQGNHKTIIATD